MLDVNTLLEYEKEYLNKGYTLIAGVDEVGRGPLAGPVVTACVIMDTKNLIQGVNDSKKLSEKKREELYEKIKQNAISYSITQVSPQRIDEVNILNATKECMQNSVNSLSVKPQVVLIDALTLNLDDSIKQLPIIKGDAKSYNIACASILAKVYRDRLMVEYDKMYPNYGLAKHKGYGTKEHIRALKTFGATKLHRKSFIKNFTKE